MNICFTCGTYLDEYLIETKEFIGVPITQKFGTKGATLEKYFKEKELI